MTEPTDKEKYLSPLVSVGVPTYNRPEQLRKALEGITGQTYKNLEIIVSDNCTEDMATDEVLAEFMKNDSRIKYVRQAVNIGAIANYRFVLDKAAGPYFIFAADDDEWEPTFIEECINLLLQNPQCGMAFTNIAAIDAFGRKYRDVPSFEMFEGKPSYMTIYKYVMAPEFYGKANIIYSLFKIELIRDALNKDINMEYWGSDMSLNLYLMIKSGVLVVNKILFKKGNISLNDFDNFKFIDIYKEKSRICHKDYMEYYSNNLIAVEGTKYYYFVKFLMLWRFLFDKKVIVESVRG